VKDMSIENKPKVSVILPTYNRAHLIDRAIRSVLSQTYQDFELIVIDDGSTDKTEEVVKSFNDSRIRYFQQNVNKGPAAARNIGIKAANGEYIAFQDSDDEWLPEKLEKQVEIIKNVPHDVGVIYSDILRIYEDQTIGYWRSPTVIYGKIINQKSLDYQVMNLTILSTLIRKECFDHIGIFNEKFPQLEDLDLLIRILKNYHFIHIKEPLAKYYAMEGISSNRKTFIARKLLIDLYFNEISGDKKFLSNQYSHIGYSLLSNEIFDESRNYFIKAFKANPFNIKSLLIAIILLFGPNAYSKIVNNYLKIQTIKVCRK
jgi:glycosyltransferase involved in cell wall biosynthesis